MNLLGKCEGEVWSGSRKQRAGSQEPEAGSQKASLSSRSCGTGVFWTSRDNTLQIQAVNIIHKLYDRLPASLQGKLDYHLRPGLRQGIVGPLNGQAHRQRMFNEIVTALKPAAIIETGTFRGTTTQYMHLQSGAPVWTTEVSPKYFAFAQCMLSKHRDVKVALSDSRAFLKKLSVDPAVPKQNVFFYLDAHWQDDLPLRDEVQIIMKSWKQVAIMVDDFKVEDDPGYTYDDYGEGKCLELSYIGRFEDYGLQAFFPSVPSSQETSLKRGSVVLMDRAATEMAGNVPSLRKFQG